MKYVMAERQDANDQEKVSPPLSQTTEQAARAAVAAAAAIRRRPSIILSSNQQKGINFLGWRRQLQNALHWGASTRVHERRNLFNPEILTRQKRQWSELQLQLLEKKQLKQEYPCFFEHFVVVGLHPHTNVQATEVALARKKAWQRYPEQADWLGGDAAKNHRRGLPQATLEPQVLFKYPPGKRLPLKSKDLPAFCFPSGVETHLMERTPSMSDLNEMMYGQNHQKRDDQSFIFLLKVADNVTLYGICVLVPEIVQQLPGILAINTAIPPPLPPGRFLASAPRCYCFMTRLPFFKLHFEVLNSIIAQERLERITQCVHEMALAQQVLPMVQVVSKDTDSISSAHGDNCPDSWMESPISSDTVPGATTAAVDLISEEEVKYFSLKVSGSLSPNEHVGKAGEDNFGSIQSFRARNASPGRMEHQDNVRLQVRDLHDLAVKLSRTEDVDSMMSNSMAPSTSAKQLQIMGHERIASSDSVNSSIFESSVKSDDDNDASVGQISPSTEDSSYGSGAVLAWAEANKNDSLRIVCAYHKTPVPQRGESIFFQPLDHLQAMEFSRPKDLPGCFIGSKFRNLNVCRTTTGMAEIQAAAIAGEEALAISSWATATLCQALSLENVVTFFSGALLEKQMVVICPNLGVLSAVVLAVIPMIRPYEWQSLLLPILPQKMLDFLDAPVPFIVGVQHKTSEVRARSNNLIRVNVYKDKVTSSSMPQLPGYKELVSTLEPYYSKLTTEHNTSKKHPIFEYSNIQARAASGFLSVLQNYLESLCMNLRSHTITNVQSNDDKVSLLLKESFVDSFGYRDRPFIKLFAETQLFSVYTDAALSSYQHC